jgi:hypothetical protein
VTGRSARVMLTKRALLDQDVKKFSCGPKKPTTAKPTHPLFSFDRMMVQ